MKLKIREERNPKNGKPITVISEIQHNPRVIGKLASDLKSGIGTGGYTEGKKIILQGSHTRKAATVLEKNGYEYSIIS